MNRRTVAVAVGVLALAWGPLGAQDGPGEAAEPLPTDAGLLLGLAREYAPWGAARQTERLAVAGQVTAVLLADADAVRSTGLARWRQFAGLLGRELTAEQRALWVEKVRAAFAPDDTALFALGLTELRDLAGTLEALGQTQEASNLAWKWLKHHEQTGELGGPAAAQAALLGLGASEVERAEKLALLEELDRRWQADNANQPLGVNECGLIGRLWVRAGNGARGQGWAMRGYDNALGGEEARAAATTDTLAAVGGLLIEFGLTDPGTGYPAFAESLARLAREGGLEVEGKYLPFFADPLGTAQTRQTVRAELVDPQGQARLAVAKVLTRAYRVAGAEEFAAWRQYVDGRVAASGGDAKALWLLAKGHVEVYVPTHPWPPRARGFLDQAFAAAESDAVRVRALGELAGYFRRRDRRVEAIGMLQSVREQFDGEAAILLIALEQQLRSEQSAAEAALARRLASAEHARRGGLLSEYRRQLARAEANGELIKATRLRAAIQRLEAESGQ